MMFIFCWVGQALFDLLDKSQTRESVRFAQNYSPLEDKAKPIS